MASHNFNAHVPSNIPENGYVIPNSNMKTQQYINQISEWTKEKKMKLNQKKCNGMIFNFCKEYQFTCKILIENEEIGINFPN